MNDHKIINTLVYVVIVCGECSETWEQAHTDPEDAGWNVCPQCLYAAPTLRERVS